MEHRFISFYEDPKLVKIIDEIAESQGSNRSVFIRTAIREKLGKISSAKAPEWKEENEHEVKTTI